MLRLLSGRTHRVITGVSVVTATRTQTAVEVTAVQFLTLSEEEIAAYIAGTGEPNDIKQECLRHPGPRRPLDSPHRRLLLQRSRPADSARLYSSRVRLQSGRLENRGKLQPRAPASDRQHQSDNVRRSTNRPTKITNLRQDAFHLVPHPANCRLYASRTDLL